MAASPKYTSTEYGHRSLPIFRLDEIPSERLEYVLLFRRRKLRNDNLTVKSDRVPCSIYRGSVLQRPTN